MTTRDLLRMLRRYGLLVLAVCALGCLSAGAIYVFQPQVYQASTKILVTTAIGEDASGLQASSSFSQERATMYAELALTPAVLDPVAEELQGTLPRAKLAENVEVQVVHGTSLMEISAVSSEPQQSALMVDEMAASLVRLSATLEDRETTPQNLVNFAVLADAEIPEEPARPDLLVYLGLGALAGALVGIGTAAFRHSLNNRVRDAGDLVALDPEIDVPIIRVPHHPGRRQSWDRLWADLWPRVLAPGNPPVILTSSHGKDASTALIDLASRAAKEGQRVLVVDGTTTGTGLSHSLGLGQLQGLSGFCAGTVSETEAIVSWEASSSSSSGVDILPAGAHKRAASHGAGLPGGSAIALKATLSRLCQVYDVILIDVPLTLPLPQCLRLGQLTSGALIVLQSGAADTDQLSAALRGFHKASIDVLGVVLLPKRRRPQPSGPRSRRQVSRREVAA